LTKESISGAIVPILPSRTVYFRARGKKSWKRHSFTILGKSSFLQPQRSLKPMQLTLESDVDGFRFVEIAGMDLFSAIASAFLTVESIILLMRNSGEVRLIEDSKFDVETDTVFFTSRVQRLRETFEIPDKK
jgi:hypothetical protein